MNLYKLHNEPNTLIKSDTQAAKVLLNEIFPKRTKLMYETGEIENEEAENVMVMMTRNKEVEDYLLYGDNNEELAIFYAKYVIGGRWHRAEYMFASWAGYAYEYALAIKDRFLAGEKQLANNWAYAFKYAKNVVKGKWPEGEPIIYGDTGTAVEYAIMINERAPKSIEDDIMDSWGNGKANYVTHFGLE